MTSSTYEELRQMIVDGKLEPGEPLREVSLAKTFGISRTPIREALRRLEQDGLVERGDRGMQVRRRSPDEILEIYEVRILLEVSAAKTAAESRTAFDLARLRQVQEAMLATSRKDAEAMAASNRRFHELVWEASHNATLVDLLTRLNAHLARYRQTTLTYKDRWKDVLREHEQLIVAIEARDAQGAAAIAEEHMTSARNIRLRMYAESVDEA